jgi:cytochrome bd ubiquinol oxidase subunit I
MTDLLAARLDMALSLGFHIVFAAVGIAMPLFMAVSEARWLRSRDPIDLALTKRWLKGTAILFAIGAVSGTVLSFQLGLLWPRFMQWAGPIIGMPFSLEGFAFFLEAIFIGIYLYAWNRVRPWVHWLAGVVVAASGALSGIFVVTANAWMNTPAGFRMEGGRVVDVDPIAAMMNPAALQQTIHMTIAAYQAVAFASAGIHAWALLRDPANEFHRRALAIVLPIGMVCAVLQPLSGDFSAKNVAEYQPAKLAAMEGLWETQRRAPLVIGGIPDERTETTRWAIELPGALSFLAFGDFDAEVKGLKEWPPEDRPPVLIVHLAFQLMVACGLAMLAVSVFAAFRWWRRRTLPVEKGLLRLLVLVSPLGFVAIESGWVVTEVGRQPWIVYGIMRTADAVTPMPGLVVPLTVTAFIYVLLAAILIALLRSQVFAPEAIARDVKAAASPARDDEAH